MGITQIFSGLPVPSSKLNDTFALIEASPHSRFKAEHIVLSDVKFFQKPPGNFSTTTKGNEIYLASNFFNFSVFGRAQTLVHEARHSLDQRHEGLAWWMTKYLASPWFRIEQELAALSNEITWFLVWRRLAERNFYSYASVKAGDYKEFYWLGPLISENSIRDRILQDLNSQWAFFKDLT